MWYFVHVFRVQGGHRVKNLGLKEFSVVIFFEKYRVLGVYNVMYFYIYVCVFKMGDKKCDQGVYRGNP